MQIGTFQISIEKELWCKYAVRYYDAIGRQHCSIFIYDAMVLTGASLSPAQDDLTSAMTYFTQIGGSLNVTL